MLLNGLGATATGVTTVVVFVANFVDVAWVTVPLAPALMLMMRSIRRHYSQVEQEIDQPTPVSTVNLSEPIVLLPIDRWSLVSQKALSYALTLSQEVQVLHVASGDRTDDLRRQWAEVAEKPARAANLSLPRLVVLEPGVRGDFLCSLDVVVGQIDLHRV